MKKVIMYVLLPWFLSIPTLYGMSAYTVSVAHPNVKAILQLNGAPDPIIVPQGRKLSKSFSAELFAEGMITAEMQTPQGKISNSCHLTFLQDSKWMTDAYLGDHCQFLKATGQHAIVVNKPVKIADKIAPSHFAPLIAERVYLVDYQPSVGGNMLFRGNSPLMQGQKNQRIDFQKLIQTMRSRYQEQVTHGKVFPKKFELIDVSLISPFTYGEGLTLLSEYRSFGGMKDSIENLPANFVFPSFDQPAKALQMNGWNFKGRLISSPIESVSAEKMPFRNNPSLVAKSLAMTRLDTRLNGKAYKTRSLDQLIQLLSRLMNARHEVPYIIYVHCIDGRDRTSEAISSYLMTQYQLPINKAYIYGTTLLKQGQKVRFTPTTKVSGFGNAVKWYCLYLKTKRGYQALGNCNVSLDNSKIISNYPWE